MSFKGQKLIAILLGCYGPVIQTQKWIAIWKTVRVHFWQIAIVIRGIQAKKPLCGGQIMSPYYSCADEALLGVVSAQEYNPGIIPPHRTRRNVNSKSLLAIIYQKTIDVIHREMARGRAKHSQRSLLLPEYVYSSESIIRWIVCKMGHSFILNCFAYNANQSNKQIKISEQQLCLAHLKLRTLKSQAL